MSRAQRRTLDGLVTAEIALACVLLVGGGLLLRAYQRVQQVDPGFNPESVLSFRVSLPASKYESATAQRDFFQRALEQLRALPGVQHAGAVSCPPLSCHWGNFLEIEHAPPRAPDAQDPVVLVRIATAGYDRALGLTLLRGRFLTEQDERADAPSSVVVNETFARTFFGEADPIGRRVRYRSRRDNNPWFTVVGLARDVKHYGLSEPMRPGIYLPLAGTFGSLALTIRTAGDPHDVSAGARAVIRSLDPELPLYDLTTLAETLRNSLALRRMYSWLLAVFAGIALTLAVGGVYGVLSYVVGRRKREIGIRVALGAERGNVLRLVLRHGVRLTIAGIIIGLAGCLLVMRWLTTLLFGVPLFDPLTYAIVLGVLGGTALLATLLPARRALRVQPQLVLKES